MTVVEYEDRLLVVDTRPAVPDRRDGRHRPRPAGLQLTCAAASTTSRAIVITHGHEDHLGALPWILRELRAEGADELPPVFGAPLTMAMARSKLDEHHLQERRGRGRRSRGRRSSSGPFDVELDPHDALDPGRRAPSRSTTDLGTVLITGDYKFDQTPVDGPPADVSRLARARLRGRAAAVRRLDERRPPGLLAERGAGRPAPAADVPALRGPDHRHLLRLEHPPRPAGRRRRRDARPQGRAARPLDAQEHEHRPLARPHRGARRDARSGRARSTTSPTSGSSSSRPGRQGEPLSALRRMAFNDHPQVAAARAATPSSSRRRRSPATSARSTRRSTGSTTSAARWSPPRDAPDPRLRPRLRRGDQADAEPRQAEVRDAVPRRLQAAASCTASSPSPSACPPTTSSRARTGCRSSSTSAARASASPSAPGMIFVDGVEIGDVADVALRDRRMLSADGIFVVVATISEQDGTSVAEPEVIFRGVPFPEEAERLLDDIRGTVERSLARAAEGQGPRDRHHPDDAARRPRRARLRPAASAGRWSCRSSSRSDQRRRGGRRAAIVRASAARRVTPTLRRHRRTPSLAGLGPDPRRRRAGGRTTNRAPGPASSRTTSPPWATATALHDRQAQARSSRRGRRRRARSARRCARAAPAGRPGRRPATVTSTRQPSAARRATTMSVPGGRVVDRVLDQVQDEPVQLVARALDDEPGLRRRPPDACSADSGAGLADGVDGDGADVDRAQVALLARRPTRASSSRSATSRRIRRELRSADAAASPLLAVELVGQQLEVGEDRRQRRAQLVRGVGDERALAVERRLGLAARALERAEHLVERRARARRPRPPRAAGGPGGRGRRCARCRARRRSGR